MALTAEVLFVNPDYMKRITQLNGGVEDAVMVPAIILAQDKYIQQYLGTDLLEKLKSDISASGVTGDYETLLDSYVRKATVWWSMVEMLPNLYVKLDNGGLVIRTAENTAAIGEDDLHREIENARQNAQFYTTRLVEYLCNNSSLFPEYKSNTGPDMSPETQVYYQNGLTISGGLTGSTLTWPAKSSTIDTAGEHRGTQKVDGEEQTQAQAKRQEVMTIETFLNLLPSLLAAVGVWVSLNSEVAKLKGRVYRLESDQGKIEAMLKECVEGIQELKILLAKKGL